jgi:hypothetical protein
MREETVITTRDQRQALSDLVRNLPAMLAGRVADAGGVAAGFRARIGFAFFSLVAPNFNELGRGMSGADGNKWRPLSPEYLAYSRGPKSTRRAGGLAPGGKDGYLSKDELALWRRIYADRLAFFIMREPDREAKAHAAAIAWLELKRLGAQTKLQKLGTEKVPGVDYQMLVDRGTLRISLQYGVLSERGPDADYQPQRNQVFDSTPGQLVVGTRVPYAAAHHAAKNPRRRRRLWPERFPADWWRQILGQAQGGLVKIAALFGGTAT